MTDIMKFRRSVEEVLELKKRGASTVVRDNQTLLITNCSVFAQHQMDVLRDRFPAIEVTFHATESSTTGFMIMIFLPVKSAFYTQAIFFETIIQLLLLAVSVTVCFSTIMR